MDECKPLEPGVRAAVKLGLDTFDSTFPTRAARHGTLLTRTRGRLNIRRSENARQGGSLRLRLIRSRFIAFSESPSCPFTLKVSHHPISVEWLSSMTLIPGRTTHRATCARAPCARNIPWRTSTTWFARRSPWQGLTLIHF